MRGLRTQENDKFKRFFSLVQKEAEKKNAVFFSDCGQGDVFENNQFECEDLCGWLIPTEQVKDFEPLFRKDDKRQHDFDDFYVSVDFKVKDDKIQIIIEQ